MERSALGSKTWLAFLNMCFSTTLPTLCVSSHNVPIPFRFPSPSHRFGVRAGFLLRIFMCRSQTASFCEIESTEQSHYSIERIKTGFTGQPRAAVWLNRCYKPMRMPSDRTASVRRNNSDRTNILHCCAKPQLGSSNGSATSLPIDASRVCRKICASLHRGVPAP